MKKLLSISALAVAAAFAFAGNASAADMPVKAAPLPPPPVYSWTGIYGGMYAGGEWDNADGSFVFPPPATWSLGHSAGILGYMSGGQIQFNQFVVGVESNFFTTIGNSASDTCHPPASCVAGATFTGRLNHVASAGGRLGWAWNQVMLYGTGGWARGQFEETFAVPPAVAGSAYQFHSNGWYAGGGIDWQAMKNFVVGVEYRHYEFDNVGGVVPSVTGAVNTANFSNLKADTVQVRFSYLFNPFPMLLH